MRPADVVLPILRAALPAASVVTWIPDVDYRTYPLVLLRRDGGPRHRTRPTKLALPVVDISVFSAEDLAAAETLYDDVLDVLFDAVRAQTQTAAGYLHSMRETAGPSQDESPFPDTWMVHGAVRLGVRPPR